VSDKKLDIRVKFLLIGAEVLFVSILGLMRLSIAGCWLWSLEFCWLWHG